MQHLLSLFDLSAADVREILDESAEIKAKLQHGERPSLLQGRVVTLLFEKPSLRTRNSFEAAAMQLGGGSIFLTSADAGMNGRESIPDVARVLSGYSDVIAMRTFSQQLIEDFAAHSSCPVINGLSDDLHPCQALTDLFTIQEVFGKLNGQRLVFVGDGNNVACSLAVGCNLLGLPITVCSPAGFELSDEFLERLTAHNPGATIDVTDDPQAAVAEADIVYTDVWASMGQEAEAADRKKAFASYQVNEALMARAPGGCKFMHDLPARRGLEVTDGVIDGPQSIAFQQAENRMHLAKGLLVWLLTKV